MRHWPKGYGYSCGNTMRGQPPVLQGSEARKTCASFLDLADLFFVKRLPDHGVSLHKICQALGEARKFWARCTSKASVLCGRRDELSLVREGVFKGQVGATSELMSVSVGDHASFSGTGAAD